MINGKFVMRHRQFDFDLTDFFTQIDEAKDNLIDRVEKGD